MAKRRPPKPSMRVKDGRQQPFTWVPNHLMRDYGAAIGPYAGWVYMALLTHANKQAECWPSHEALATMTGISLAQVKLSLQRLQTLGLIAVTTRRPKTSVYTILDVPERPDNSSEVAITPEPSNSQEVAINSQDVAINSQDVAIEQLRGSYEVDVVELDPPNQIHRTTSSSSPPPEPPSSAPIPTDDEDEEALCARLNAEEDRRFEQFWDAYPRHVDRPEARRVFVEAPIDDATLADILAALKVQIPAWKQQGMRVGFKPADYLRDKMWLDVKPEAAKGVPAWLEEDKPAEIPTCDVRSCHHLAGRYSSKRCDKHVEEDMRAEAGKLLDIMRNADPTADDPDALESELLQRAQSYHLRETAVEIAWQLRFRYSPEKPLTFEDILATICSIQEAAEAERRARAAQPKRKLELAL